MGLDDFIYNELGGHAQSGDEVPVDCIECGKENHLYVNTKSGLAYCFACGYSANLIKLIQDLKGIHKWEAAVEASKLLTGLRRYRGAHDLRRESNLIDSIMQYFWGAKDSSESKIKLPNATVSLAHPRARAARQYLALRGMTQAHFGSYKLRYVTQQSDEWRYRNHIVFPHFNSEGDIIYYTTRFAGTPKEGAPKSLHPHEVKRPDELFGAWNLQRSQGVFIVEGPFDMLAMPGCSVALLGKLMSESQAMWVAENLSDVTVALDNTAGAEAGYAAAVLRAARTKGIHVARPDGDPADMVCEDPMGVVLALLRQRVRWTEEANILTAVAQDYSPKRYSIPFSSDFL